MLYVGLCCGILFYHCVFVQSPSCVWLLATPWTAARQASLSITIPWSLLKLMSIESVMPSNYLILCLPLLLWPSIFPSIRVFSNESALHIRWPNMGASALTSVLPMNIQDWFPLGFDWFVLLAVQGTFFGAQPFLWSNSHISTWLLEKALYTVTQVPSVLWALSLILGIRHTKGTHHLPSRFLQWSWEILAGHVPVC